MLTELRDSLRTKEERFTTAIEAMRVSQRAERERHRQRVQEIEAETCRQRDRINSMLAADKRFEHDASDEATAECSEVGAMHTG